MDSSILPPSLTDLMEKAVEEEEMMMKLTMSCFLAIMLISMLLHTQEIGVCSRINSACANGNAACSSSTLSHV